MFDNGDVLLYALSSWRSISWYQFKRWCDEIQRTKMNSIEIKGQSVSGTYYRWEVVRVFSTLGHIELEMKPSKISVHIAPPVIASLPMIDSHRAVLCGARSPALIEEIQSESRKVGIEVLIHSQSDVNPFAPCVVDMRAENRHQFEQLSKKTRIPYPNASSARSLVHAAVPLNELRQRLDWSNKRDLNWPRMDFDTESLRFRPFDETSQPQPLLSTFRNPISSIPYHRIRNNRVSAEVNLDWGRFLVLAAHRKRVLTYSREKRTVEVPIGVPLPTLLSRALGLCSGRSPDVIEGENLASTRRHLVYKNVPPSVFDRVAEKLNQIEPN